MSTNATPVLAYDVDAAPGGIGTETWAILVDAYRRLAAGKIFWITVVLSALVAGVFFFVGIDERGLNIFGMHIDAVFNTRIISPGDFYRFLFSSLAIPWWLGVFAFVLALVSVAGIFPDLLESGSIDLYISRSISRWRLFVTMYIGGLVFAALQVGVFSVIAMLVMLVRAGSFEPRLLWAVPLVTLAFSYLFAIAVLVGVLTRSTLASLLVTVLAWGLFSMLGLASDTLHLFSISAEQNYAEQAKLTAYGDGVLERNAKLPTSQQSDTVQIARKNDLDRRALEDAAESRDKLQWWHHLLANIYAPLPKPAATTRLLSRVLLKGGELDEFRDARQDNRRRRPPGNGLDPGDPQVQAEFARRQAARSAYWPVFSSLGFEAVLLLLAGWSFARRDF